MLLTYLKYSPLKFGFYIETVEIGIFNVDWLITKLVKYARFDYREDGT